MGYTLAMKNAVGAAVVSAIDDAGASAARIIIYDSANVVLVTLALAATPAVLDTGTGRVNLSPGATPTAAASGTADHASLVSENDVILADDLPVAQGSTAVAGSVVISSLTIVSGADVQLIAASIG